MSLLQRATTLVALTLGLAALGTQSTAANAAELTQVALSAPVSSIINGRAADPVPDVIPDPILAADADLAAGDVVAYPTLAAAVAAQAISDDSDRQLRCLAGAIYYESKGEPLAGQLAVAQVVINRAESGRFADDVCGVVTQPGQFSFVRGGRIPDVDSARPAYRTAMAVAKVALTDAWEGGAGRALYFHARRVSPRWSRTRIASIGNHVFYR